jgi:hypothetical protein
MRIKAFILAAAVAAGVALPGAASAQWGGYGQPGWSQQGRFDPRFDPRFDRGFDRRDQRRWQQQRRWEQRQLRQQRRDYRRWVRQQQRFDRYDRW